MGFKPVGPGQLPEVKEEPWCLQTHGSRCVSIIQVASPLCAVVTDMSLPIMGVAGRPWCAECGKGKKRCICGGSWSLNPLGAAPALM
jgi:hypothetical protein